MRWVCLCFAFIFAAGITARAENFSSIPSDITYEQKDSSRSNTYDALDKHFSNLNFEILNGQHDPAPPTPLAWIDKIYVTKNFGKGDARVVFAKYGIDIKGSVEFNKIYKHPKGYVVHYKRNN